MKIEPTFIDYRRMAKSAVAAQLHEESMTVEASKDSAGCSAGSHRIQQA